LVADASGKPLDDTAKAEGGRDSSSSLSHSSSAKALSLEKKKRSIAVTIATASAIVPAFSEHDQAILEQLASEEKKEGVALNSFCSRFKGPKMSRDNDNNNNNTSDKAGGGATNANGTNNPKNDDTGASSSSAPKSTHVNAETAGAPSVQIIDGQIVLQEASVMMPSRRTVQEVEEEFRDNVVEEDEQLNLVQASYNSFVTKGDHGKTRKKGSWSIEETERFYTAVKQLGTDFGSMEVLFFENERTRKQLKNKYRRELSKNPNLVQELALNPKYQIGLGRFHRSSSFLVVFHTHGGYFV